MLTEANERRMAEVRTTVEQRLKDMQADNAVKLEEMRRTVDDGVMMWAESATPISTGPMVVPWETVVLSTLNKILAASRLGQIRMLASPCKDDSSKPRPRTLSSKAASPCISPSHSMCGCWAQNKSRAWRTLSADLRVEEP